MELIHELLGYERIKIIQDEEMFKFSLDSILIANFVNVNSETKRIIDLGCGNAPIPLYLSLKTNAKIIGVEIQEEVADLATRSVRLNNLQDQIEIINANFIDIYKKGLANSFDIAVSNPPHFKYTPTTKINKNRYLTIARHEIKATLFDVVNEAKKLLNDGGSFYMVHRVSRLGEIINVLQNCKFKVKTLQFVYSKNNSNEALLVLIEAKKNRKPSLKVIEPFYIYKDNGEYTQNVRKIFNFNKSN